MDITTHFEAAHAVCIIIGSGAIALLGAWLADRGTK